MNIVYDNQELIICEQAKNIKNKVIVFKDHSD